MRNALLKTSCSTATMTQQQQQLLGGIALAALLAIAPAYADQIPDEFSTPLGIQIESSYTYDDNVTRGDEKLLADSAIAISLRKPVTFPVSDNLRARLTGLVEAEKFLRYDGLSRLTGGVQGDLQYRHTAESSAATYSLFARASADQYRSNLRDGQRYSTGLSMLQPLTDRISLYAALAHNQRNGKNAVFDTRDNSAALNLDFELNSTGTLYLGAEYHKGDAVTTGSSLYGTNITVWEDAFRDKNLYSTRLDGSTVLATLGYNIGLGSNNSFDISWRQIRSTLNYTNAWWRTSTATYTTNQYSVAYLVRL